MSKNEISSSVRDRLLSVLFEDMPVYSVVKAEVFFGNSGRIARNFAIMVKMLNS